MKYLLKPVWFIFQIIVLIILSILFYGMKMSVFTVVFLWNFSLKKAKEYSSFHFHAEEESYFDQDEYYYYKTPLDWFNENKSYSKKPETGIL